jgi:hypothetical protein
MCYDEHEKLCKREKINKTYIMSTQTPQNHSPKRSSGRPKGYKPFSEQSDSKCLSTLTAFRKFINEKAGGDATGLILAYLESRHAKTHFDYRRFDRSFELSRINKLLSGVKTIYNSTTTIIQGIMHHLAGDGGITLFKSCAVPQITPPLNYPPN